MSSVALFFRRSHGALLSRLIWPTALLFAATLLSVFATIVWTSDSANVAAAARQRMQLNAALEQKLHELKSDLAQLAASPEFLSAMRSSPSAEALVSRLGQRAARSLEFTGTLLIAEDGRVVSGIVDGAIAGQAAYDQVRALFEGMVDAARSDLSVTLRPGSRPAAQEALGRNIGISRLFSDGTATYAAVALPLEAGDAIAGPQAPPRVLVAIAYKRFSDTDLERIAELHAIDDFTVGGTRPEAGRIALAIGNGRGEIKSYLSWTPERPGDLMRQRLIPLTVFGAAVAVALFGFIVGYIRWIAKDLARSQAQTQKLVGRDPLSGLPNRLLFSERLDMELSRLGRGRDGLAVMFLDLDRFKEVNDSYGHQAGDELIKMVAQRLARILRNTDTLARFGGDEFAVIQTNLRAPQDAEALARRILHEVTHPFEIGGAAVTVGVSVGISLAPQNGADRETLMRLADTALYQAKSSGRNRYSFFEQQMDETIRMRKVVEDDLRDAIQHDRLVLHYQPIYSADGGSIVAVEALVRWPHPRLGLISPAQFIAVAEERGLIIPLGEWVLRRACQDGKRWPDLRVAVNVSPVQFRHRDFVASVTSAITQTGFDPSRLEIELTEGVVVDDADAAEAAMMRLRTLGVHLALDDFGTGYSSLIYLRRFAFDKIKIDRSFLESMEATGESAILIHSIVHLGRALGLVVTAEGVETREQHRFLQALGCHQLQGFLFSRPVPAEDIDRMLGSGAAMASAA